MRIIYSILLSLIISLPMYSQEDKTSVASINHWLYSGQVEVKMPVLNNSKDVNGKTFNLKRLLKFDQVDVAKFRPEANEFATFSGQNWSLVSADEEGMLKFAGNKSSLSYFVSYIEVNRFTKARLKIESSAMFEVYVNGKAVGGIYSAKDDELSKFSKDLTFEKQNYAVVLKVLTEKENELAIKATLEFSEPYAKGNLTLTTSPKHFMDITHVLEGPRVNNVQVSADGLYYFVTYSEITVPEGKTKNWIEFYELKTNKLVSFYKDPKFRNIHWLPSGHKYSYRSGNSFFVADPATQNHELLGENIKGNYQWAPNEEFIIYSVSEDGPEKNKLAQKVENMQDRWPWWRSRSFLFKYELETGLVQRLTFGNLTTNLHDISPDSKKIIYNESRITNLERPYENQSLYELNLETMELDTIWVKQLPGYVSYSPDGTQLLVTGSPALFGEVGINLKEHNIANDYEVEAYIYNLNDGKVKSLTYDFDPSIESVYWKDANTIYFDVEEKSYSNLYKYDIKKSAFELIETNQDMLSSIDFSKQSYYAGYTSQGINNSNKGYVLNLKKNESTLVADPEKEFFADVEFGDIKDCVYTTKKGGEVDGFVYYPPNFNPEEKYPVIVYYYGGTSPINRNFLGRYPKELYTAHGYIVYVVNPSGATGYGQDFAAAHVNNWGETVADEIIEATQHFAQTHSYVNADKIGCMGASYGGFMTMLLMTKTDVFATGIAHAGISSISSYWGEGYWGYQYSSVASANSFPWNNKKLYVDQSPLFNADKQVNSILLLHGGSDTNVPVGESIQQFAALRLLGKEVEFVQIPGEDHWILDYKKRIAWQKTIAAWFDRELKDEPEWWEDLYPDTNLK